MVTRVDDKIASEVLKFYFSSRDFNGIPLEDLYRIIGLNENHFKEQITILIKNRSIDLIYEGEIPNPHIKPFPAPEIDKQIEKLQSIDIEQEIKDAENDLQTFGEGEMKISVVWRSIGCCVYPSPKFLQRNTDWRHYNSRPFTLRLAMGEWQLRPYFFELGVLAIYRNDPRYRYETDDISGSLYSTEDELLNPTDRIFLKYFYFGFDNNGTRAVAVLLADLRSLTSEHQQIWKAKMLANSYRFALHPDARKSILGYFPEKTSIFTAFLEELRVISEMSRSIKSVSLLKETFDDNKPENFGFLILPTLREYEMFCHTLDRMMCENLNEIFFEGEIDNGDLEKGEKIEDIKGKTIKKLNIWLKKFFKSSDEEPKKQMIETFKRIRQLRSKPAHAYYVNQWDLNFYKKQKDLVKEAYTAIRILRLILANHPGSKKVRVPEWLYIGKIRSF